MPTKNMEIYREECFLGLTCSSVMKYGNKYKAQEIKWW